MVGLDQTGERRSLGITSDDRTLCRRRSIMDSGEHRRSTMKDLQTVSPDTMLPTEGRRRGRAIVPTLHRIKAFARRQQPNTKRGR